MDKIIFSGNCGKDAAYEERDGRETARFSVAVNHTVKGEKQTEWRNVTVFGKQSQFCRDWVKKGRTVIVEGRPSVRVYKNKLEETVATMDVLADRVELIGGKQEGDTQHNTAPAGPVVVDEPMPF